MLPNGRGQENKVSSEVVQFFALRQSPAGDASPKITRKCFNSLLYYDTFTRSAIRVGA